MDIKAVVDAVSTLKHASEETAPLMEKAEAVQKRLEPTIAEMNDNLEKLGENTAALRKQADKIQKAISRYQAGR